MTVPAKSIAKRHSRRQFVKQTAVAAAAIGAPYSVPSSALSETDITASERRG
jgi:hypothetical protein